MKMISVGAVMAAALGSQSAMAQDSDTADATATIVTALDIAKVKDLRFGAIVKPTSDSSNVTIATNGNRSFTGNAALQTSAFGAASFSVTGTAGVAYNVALLGDTGSADGITLTEVTASCTGGTPGGSGLTPTLTNCSSYTAEDLKVGGTINITAASTATGPVTVGTVQATVTYQ